MRSLALMLILALFVSCAEVPVDSADVLKAHPYLIGEWTGEGNFLDRNTNSKIGSLDIKVEINADNSIVGKIGDAALVDASIQEAKYGFGVKALLDSKVNEEADFDKDHVIILLVTPEKNAKGDFISDANFHVTGNFFFDFGMRVGGVMLTKSEM